MKMELIKLESRLCECCMEEHNVKMVKIHEKITFKDVKVEYIAECFFCDVAGEFYVNETMMRENDINMKDAYRKKMGLLESTDIKNVRSKYGISQSDLCVLLGWGGKTITRYESHQVQDKAHDTILKKLDKDPEWFLFLLEESKPALNADMYRKYYDIGRTLYEKSQDMYLRKSIEAKYACFQEKANYNGNVELSLDKVVDVIKYFSNASNVTNLYKVKLMKLLWYADCLSYKTRGYAITGLVYQALPMGAVPIGHDSIIDLQGICYEEIDIGDGTAYKFIKSEDRVYKFLNDEDIDILDKVIMNLGNMSKDEIVNFMHNEKAYIKTLPKEIISFEYANSLQI